MPPSTFSNENSGHVPLFRLSQTVQYGSAAVQWGYTMREATSNSGEEKYIYKIWVLPDDVISAVLVVASYVMMTVEAEAIMTSYSFNQPDENILISPLHIRYSNLQA